MTLAILPPKTEELIDDQRFSTLNWTIFFEALANGDAGTAWTPSFQGLTEAGGAAVKSGVYYRISKKLALYRITITPASGGSTSSILGTTFCDNLPLNMASDSFCVTCSSYTAALSGTTFSDKRIYPQTWTTITTPITIIGIAEIR